MISLIEGEIIHQDKNFLIISAGGVGFKVYTAKDTMGEILKDKMKKVRLWTYLAVRENSLDLYGFHDRDGLNFFELLLSVSGIGPKSALAILNIAPVKTLRSAIATGDASHLTKTTVIGTKKAEKIILELRDKLDVSESDISEHKDESDVIEALKALGYSERESREALKKIPRDISTAEDKIKQALKQLGK